MIFKNKTFLWMGIMALWLVAGCDKDDRRPIPDVDHIEAHAEITRLEQELASVDTIEPEVGLATIKGQYPMLFECYTESITGVAKPGDSTLSFAPKLASYLNYPGYLTAYDSVMKAYPELDFLENELNQAFQYYKFYFPQDAIPEVFTFVSEYAYGAVTCYDSLLGIGLDFYLAPGYPYYKSLGYPDYMIRRFTSEHISRDAMMSIAQNKYGGMASSDVLIDRMIFQGKLLYFLDLTLPRTPDSIKMGYTANQTAWLEHNEAEVWAYFLDRDRLFIKDRMEGKDYVNVGPRTPGMPGEAPGNVGSWVGWQVVRAFMAKNRDVSFDELMDMTNGQKVLQLSGYKP